MGPITLESYKMLGYSVLCWKEQKLLLTEDPYLLFAPNRKIERSVWKIESTSKKNWCCCFYQKFLYSKEAS